MLKILPYILFGCCALFACADTRVARPTTLKCRCTCASNEFVSHINDTLHRYGFINYHRPHHYALNTVKNFDDGMSVRTVYLDAIADSASTSLTLIVKTVVKFRSNIDTIYYDESVKTIPDNRQDFVPVFNALRTLCQQQIPLQDHQKKRQLVPWKR
ncbi:MAG TPA: hypothetical protein PLW09_07805 [Candidatus Kapabacteria bacterium]|jgi:hypothetical protein|nr:hypothetical protein [Ignavibacteria bacterium]HRE57713.1 hypothetical protein [Candidatus Kapabacteria bacterium]